MPRRRRPSKRKIKADSVYGSRLVMHFINCLMDCGKKSTAEKIFYGSMDTIKQKGADPVTVFKKAIDNVKPLLEVKSRRVGGATYQIPVDVRAERRTSLGIRWIINAAKERQGKSMIERLVAEFTDAANGAGTAVKKKEDMHRMAEANRAFVHYRW